MDSNRDSGSRVQAFSGARAVDLAVVKGLVSGVVKVADLAVPKAEALVVVAVVAT